LEQSQAKSINYSYITGQTQHN